MPSILLGNERNISSSKQEVQLTLSATNLPNTKGLLKGVSDPYAIVTILADKSGSQSILLGRTETVKNNLSPTWTKAFVFDYELSKRMYINIGIFGEIRKAKRNKPVGSATFEIGDILGRPENCRGKRLKQSDGVVYAMIKPAPKSPAGTLYLELRGLNLRNVDRGPLGLGKSDPFFEVSRRDEQPGGKVIWTVVSRSKHIKSNLNPTWKPVEVTLNRLCDNKQNQPIRIAVLDWEKNGNHKFIGAVEVTLDVLVRAVNHDMSVKDGKTHLDVDNTFTLTHFGSKVSRESGSLVVTNAVINGAAQDPQKETLISFKPSGDLHLEIQGKKIKNVDRGILGIGKSDPFFEVSRQKYTDGKLASWSTIIRSEHINNTLNPCWRSVRVPIDRLCDNNHDAPILLSVYDYEKDGKHQFIGSVETTVTILRILAADTHSSSRKLISDDSRGLHIKGRDKHVSGLLVIKSATLSVRSDSTRTFEPSDLSVRSNSIIATETKRPPRQQRPTFLEYIMGGCELNLCVAVDFSGSNGNPMEKGTLHYMRDGAPNEYEQAITAVCSILAKYDYDNKFPVWGFGAKYDGVMQNCFQIGKEAEGLEGILQNYKSVFSTNIIMSTPTVIHPVIKVAASQARESQKQANGKGKQAYTILLILTNGCVSELEETQQALLNSSTAPLSIVIVGIGNNDFSAMKHLDNLDVTPPERDITKFVEFRAFQHDRGALAEATLDEIPDQLVDYFFDNDIRPLPATSDEVRSKINILPHCDTTHFDVEMNFNEDGTMHIADDADFRRRSSRQYMKS